MTERVATGNLRVAKVLYDFINNEALPGTDIDPDTFWAGVDKVVTDLGPRNQELLARRDELQAQIDKWHRHRVIEPIDQGAYRQFLVDIGYLRPEPEDFAVTTANVDAEITSTAGPQLVVPILNARFALNAANARWGSLYDALYGTDVISEDDGAEQGDSYNRVRGDLVIAYARRFLDDAVPLANGSYDDATGFKIGDGRLIVTLDDDRETTLAQPTQFVGYTGDPDKPESVLLVNHGLHVDILIDPESPIGQTDKAGIKDVYLESAITTIMDFEDAVAAVDADDKVKGYRNWLGLNKGDLAAEVSKDGNTFTRVLHEDRRYTAPDGSEFTLPGRSLLFVRNVGHLMTNDAITDADGNEVFEGIQDALFTSLIAIHGMKSGEANGPMVNSRTGSIYIVKPKMHGPDEVAFAVELFGRVEDVLGLPQHDQGRNHGRGAAHQRQPQGLHPCRGRPGGVHQHRLFGPHRRRDPHLDGGRPDGPQGHDEVAARGSWPTSDNNVDIGLACGLRGHAQIGKGMWTMPTSWATWSAEDRPPQGRCHHRLGAVPDGRDPARAALPPGRRRRGAEKLAAPGTARDAAELLLTIPLGAPTCWEPRGHPSRSSTTTRRASWATWCAGSTRASARRRCPTSTTSALMEDRATLRISSQHSPTGSHHGVRLPTRR